MKENRSLPIINLTHSSPSHDTISSGLVAAKGSNHVTDNLTDHVTDNMIDHVTDHVTFELPIFKILTIESSQNTSDGIREEKITAARFFK